MILCLVDECRGLLEYMTQTGGFLNSHLKVNDATALCIYDHGERSSPARRSGTGEAALEDFGDLAAGHGAAQAVEFAPFE